MVIARAQKGFTYLGVLVAVASLGIGLAAISDVWVAIARHRRAEQLEWVGQQYVRAIGSYYEGSPDGVRQYPPTIDALLEDKRYVTVRRHLREAYVNPMTGRNDWEIVPAAAGGIRGVRVTRTSTSVGVNAVVREFTYTPNIAR